ncbi:SecY-interacting protein [Chromatiaceae bacterium AAb-1]|nr:SecY-interacting protein [Chromatiaceae bacterium AAb-1]
MEFSHIYTAFIERAIQWHQQHRLPLLTWADPASVSPCQQGEAVDGQVHWKPVLQQPVADFSNVEQALELVLHPDITAFYSLYYGAGLAAEHPKGRLALLMVWNKDDLVRLQENIIGHILMKRRLKQQETVFFAVTDDDSIMLSVLNSTGEVFLEHTGKEVKEKLADNLADFISGLTPAAYEGF